jgi:hypothetical protein
LSHLIDRILDTNSINKFLGIGNSYSNVIASFALALVTFFYIFTISSYFSVSVFILKNRVIYVDTFDKYVINQHLDHILIAVGIVVWFLLAIKGNGRFYMSSIYAGLAIIGLLFGFDLFTDIGALSSLPVIIFLLIYDRSVARKKILHADTKLSLNYLAIMGAITGVVGVILSFEPLLSIQLSSHIRNYAYDIFTLFSIFSPVLMFLMIFCFPVKLVTNEFTNKLLKSKNKKNNNNRYSGMSTFFFRADTVRLRTKVVYLTLFVLLSIILVIIPHTPAINKNNQEIGVDTHYYVDWIAPLIRSNNTQEFIHQAFVIQAHDGDRPIALIFLFAIIKLVSPNDFSYTIEHVPLILGPALVLVVYFLTRELTSNEKSSLFASFLTAVSYQMLIGIYAGFYANWLAIIIGFISAIFLFKFLKSSRKRDIIVFGVSLVTIMLTHTYTWTIFVIVFVTFLAVMLATKDYSTRIIVLLLTVTLFSVVIDIARISITGSISGVLGDTQLASDLTGLEQFAQRWNTLIETVYIYVGGQFSNFIPLALGLYWLFSSDLRKASNIFMIIFLSTGLLPLFAGNWLLQVRVLYNIPFQIPAAIALTYMSNRGHTSRIFLPAIILWLTAASVTAVSNFYLIPTSQNMSFGTS